VTVHQLKVSLAGIAPPIWRRVQVRSGADLAQLHEVLQIAMGWENYHMYGFETRCGDYGPTEGAAAPQSISLGGQPR
jgi:hypothetical protein